MSVNNPSENVSDRFRVCSFVFIKIKRKRNLKGEFMKIFKEVFNTKFYQTMVFRVQFSTLVAIELKHRGNVIVTGRWQNPKKKRYAFVLAAAEKITLFPNPVGNCPKTSLLPTMFSIVSFCSDFNLLSGNTAKLSISACWRSSTNLAFSAILAILWKTLLLCRG